MHLAARASNASSSISVHWGKSTASEPDSGMVVHRTIPQLCRRADYTKGMRATTAGDPGPAPFVFPVVGVQEHDIDTPDHQLQSGFYGFGSTR